MFIDNNAHGWSESVEGGCDSLVCIEEYRTIGEEGSLKPSNWG